MVTSCNHRAFRKASSRAESVTMSADIKRASINGVLRRAAVSQNREPSLNTSPMSADRISESVNIASSDDASLTTVDVVLEKRSDDRRGLGFDVDILDGGRVYLRSLVNDLWGSSAMDNNDKLRPGETHAVW
jgi:hypothetical protein